MHSPIMMLLFYLWVYLYKFVLRIRVYLCMCSTGGRPMVHRYNGVLHPPADAIDYVGASIGFKEVLELSKHGGMG